jgi:transketolase
MGDLKAKWEAFGWRVLSVKNGNNLSELLKILAEAKTFVGKEKPIMILMKTEMGHGVDFMMGSHKWHGVAPNDEQLKEALTQNYTDTVIDY